MFSFTSALHSFKPSVWFQEGIRWLFRGNSGDGLGVGKLRTWSINYSILACEKSTVVWRGWKSSPSQTLKCDLCILDLLVALLPFPLLQLPFCRTQLKADLQKSPQPVFSCQCPENMVPTLSAGKHTPSPSPSSPPRLLISQQWDRWVATPIVSPVSDLLGFRKCFWTKLHCISAV